MARRRTHRSPQTAHQPARPTPRRQPARPPARHRNRNRKELSQNFLYRPEVLHTLVRAAEVGPDDLVVEPGAGPGTLTRALAGAARHVLAYELDPALAARLPQRVRPHANVRVTRGDFLRAHPPREPFAVVGNIPYSRTSDIVRWCLEARQLTSATLLTQLEYARKRTGHYGRWTLVTVRHWPTHDWRLVGRVSREHFTPVPRTDSGVLRIERRAAPLVPAHQLAAYRAFVADGFSGVGGSLAATLSRHHRPSRVRVAYRALDLAWDLPCGLVEPDAWVGLFRRLAAG